MTAAAPDALAALTRGRTNVVFGTILLGILLAALDQTIVSTALPTITADLGGAEHLSWVVTAYLLAQTVSVALAGKFGDLFGRKLVFQVSAAVFVVGSMLCGLATGMTWLIVCRAVQGIGGGGLMVTSTALIADVIPLRERGRYQGALGAVFGVTTVVGPLLGGLFTDHLSWRWAFYVNVPLAVVVIVAAAATIPGTRTGARPVIDYLGIGLLAAGSVALTLGATWGGSVYPWASATIVGLFAGAVVALAAFVVVERRAEEPTLPMHLFRNPVFAVATPLSFVVGFAMLGSLTFLPTFLQYVQGVSATDSGLRMLPMVVGLLVASTAAGTAVGRTGRYKVFPVTGTLVMGVGLALLATMGPSTSVLLTSLYMLVLGTGIGLSMQVLTLVVQNTAEFRDLGVATSGVTYFRTIGSSFGAAIFGTVYGNVLGPRLAAAVAGLDAEQAAAASNPAGLVRLPAAVREPIVAAYADSLQTVFLAAVPVALVGFVLALALKQVPMRDTVAARPADLGDGFAMPAPPQSAECLERAIGRLAKEKGPEAFPRIVADSGTGVDVDTFWCLVEVGLRSRHGGQATLDSIAREHRVPPGVLQPAFSLMATRGYLHQRRGRLELTDTGRANLAALTAAWKRWLRTELTDWHPELDAHLDTVIDGWARRLTEDERQPVAAR